MASPSRRSYAEHVTAKDVTVRLLDGNGSGLCIIGVSLHYSDCIICRPCFANSAGTPIPFSGFSPRPASMRRTCRRLVKRFQGPFRSHWRWHKHDVDRRTSGSQRGDAGTSAPARHVKGAYRSWMVSCVAAGEQAAQKGLDSAGSGKTLGSWLTTRVSILEIERV